MCMCICKFGIRINIVTSIVNHDDFKKDFACTTTSSLRMLSIKNCINCLVDDLVIFILVCIIAMPI